MGRSWVFLASWHFRMIKPALAQPYEISSHTMKPGQALDRDAQERHSAFFGHGRLAIVRARRLTSF